VVQLPSSSTWPTSQGVLEKASTGDSMRTRSSSVFSTIVLMATRVRVGKSCTRSSTPSGTALS